MKTYTKKTIRLKALPRSKRARYGSTGASSSTPSSPAAAAMQGEMSGHTHSNLPELEKFSTDSDGYGYLNRVVESSDGSVTRQNDKIKSGYADDSGNWGGHAFDDYIDQPVRKTDISEFAGLIAGLLKSRGFTSGALGSGFMLGYDGDGNAVLEVDKVIVRKAMEVAELIIQQLSHQGGISIYTPASIECTSVVATSSGYKCSFDNHSNTVPNLFKQGDQARCQRFNLGSTSAKYYWRLVTEVGSDYIVLSKSDCDSGSGIPEAGDRIIQMGNRSDEARQKAAVMDVIGTDAPRLEFYGGINSYDLTGKLITVIGVVDGKVGVYTDAGRFNNIKIGAGSSGLENLTEWAGKQNEIDSAKSEAKSAGQKAENAKATADSATKAAESAQGTADNAKALANHANTAAANAQETADTAAAIASTAASDAANAKSRLDDMASDSIISPVEKTALLQQKYDIASEYRQIVSDCERYGVSAGGYIEAYDLAMAALEKYTADMTSDAAKESDYTDIADYYDQRQAVLAYISAAARKVADDAQKTADDAARAVAALSQTVDDAVAAIGTLDDDTKFTIPEKRTMRQIMQAITSQKGTAEIYSGTIARSMLSGDEWVKVTQADADADPALLPYVGFYRSQNRTASSYSTVRLTFEISSACIMTLEYASDGENNFDYLAVSKLDPASDLTETTLASAEFNTQGNRGVLFSRIYALSAGTHTLQIMYRKGISANVGIDSGYYRIVTERTEGYNSGLSGQFHEHYDLLDDANDPGGTLRKALHDGALVPLMDYMRDTCGLWEDTVTDMSAAGDFRDRMAKLLRAYYSAQDKAALAFTRSDYEYLTRAFAKGKTVINGGVVMSEAVAVRNSEGEVEGMLNGSENFEDGTHGKAIVISGIPSQSSSGSTVLSDRVKEAETIVYEDGTVKTRKLQAEAGTFSGELIAPSGTIGGFDIEGERLYGHTESEFSNKSMTLGPGQCFYSSRSTGTSSGTVDIKSALGTSVLPAVSGIDKVGLGCTVSVSQNVVGDTVIAGYFSASGKTQDNSGADFGSHALYLENGTVAGFRPVTRVISTSQNLSKMDSVLVVKNTSTITLTLPSSPQRGQTYLILHTTSTKLNISGSSTYQINRVAAGSIATTQNSTNREGILLIFDGTNWQLMYL